jgi:hypothetical protein
MGCPFGNDQGTNQATLHTFPGSLLNVHPLLFAHAGVYRLHGACCARHDRVSLNQPFLSCALFDAADCCVSGRR